MSDGKLTPIRLGGVPKPVEQRDSAVAAPGSARTAAGFSPPLVPKGDSKMPTPQVAPQPVEGGETVKITVDGKEVEVAKGANVLEACRMVGKDICHFCYHPGLSIAASCRQCLVEIEKMPKLMPSCQAVVGDGMVVHTESERVQTARTQMLEYTLVNHPIDCPICDKAGECVLQRHYMDHDHEPTRVDVPKVRKAKVKDIGEHIVLDAERCILCSRCIRFCDEVPGTGELTFKNRGDHEELDVAEGHRLDNPYSLNVVDVCPVGALTSKDFRFQIRAWELRGSPSTCPGCATGCSIELHHKDETAYRIVPRNDVDVNGYWMCDEGRMQYKQTDPALRVREASVDGETVPLADALRIAAERLKGKKVAAVFSATATNEANAALDTLATHLDSARFLVANPKGEGDDLLRDADRNPNSAGAAKYAGDGVRHGEELALELAGRAYEAVIWLDGAGEVSEVSLKALRECTSVCLADRRTAVSDACTVVLPAASWAEIVGSYTNRDGRLRVLQPAWRPEGARTHRADLLARLATGLGVESCPSARDRSRALGEAAGDATLLQLTESETRSARPRLMRWGHVRG